MTDIPVPVHGAMSGALVAEPAPEPASNGYLSLDQIKSNAPKDLREEDVEAFGGKIRIRSLTAAQSAEIEQAGVAMNPTTGRIQMKVVDAIVKKFELGVIQPEMNSSDVMYLFQQAGPSFMRVIQAIDRISGTEQGEMAKAQAAFPGTDG
jgi:hypothetical protein